VVAGVARGVVGAVPIMMAARSSIFCEFTAFASCRLALSARGSLLSCRFPRITNTEGSDEDDGVEYDFRW